MACVSGTNIVNDGLVFHFDLENGVKSFKGKPTSNLLANTDLLDWSGTSSRGSDTTTNEETYNGGTVWHLEDADGVDPDISIDNYWMYNSYSPVAAGEQYTFSMDVKVLQKSNSAKVGASNCFWIWYAQSTEFVYFSDLPLNEWTRVHVTCTVGSTYNYIIPRIDYDNTILEIANLQLEAGNVATKFVNGVRLDTASIIDLSPNRNTITAANLTYRQDDTPTFDGTNDYIDIPNNLTYTSEVSAFGWFKSTGTPSGNYHIILGGQELEISIPTSGQIRTGIVQGGRYVSNHGSGLVDGNWHEMGFTFDGTTKTSFIDGANVGTQSIPTGTLTSVVPNRRIGRFGSSSTYYANGEISQVKIYNKALTEAEVKQNFEATRSRYGI